MSKVEKQVREGKYFITKHKGCKLIYVSRAPIKGEEKKLTDGQGNIPVCDEFNGFWSATNYARKLVMAEHLCEMHHQAGWNSMTIGMIMSSMTPAMMRKEIKQLAKHLAIKPQNADGCLVEA